MKSTTFFYCSLVLIIAIAKSVPDAPPEMKIFEQEAESEDIAFPIDSIQQVSFPELNEAFSVKIQLEKSSIEDAKSFCYASTYHEKFSRVAAGTFLKGEKSITHVHIPKTRNVLILSNKWNLLQVKSLHLGYDEIVNLKYFEFKKSKSLLDYDEFHKKVFDIYSIDAKKVKMFYNEFYDLLFLICHDVFFFIDYKTLELKKVVDTSIQFQLGDIRMAKITDHLIIFPVLKNGSEELWWMNVERIYDKDLKLKMDPIDRKMILKMFPPPIPPPTKRHLQKTYFGQMPWMNRIYTENATWTYDFSNYDEWLVIDKSFIPKQFYEIPKFLKIQDIQIVTPKKGESQGKGRKLMVMFKSIGILSFDIDEDFYNSQNTLDFSINIQNGIKFAIDDKNLVLVAELETGPTLIELNYYQLKNETKKRFHFNRAIPYLTNIQQIDMDSKRTYLIGKNVHFIYKQGIYYEFVKSYETIFYEFIDRKMIGLSSPFKNDDLIHYYYSYTPKGMEVYTLEYRSPQIQCQTDQSNGSESSQKLIDNYFDYKLEFLTTSCEQKKDKIEDDDSTQNELFYACQITKNIRLNVMDEKDVEKWVEKQPKTRMFGFGFLIGICLSSCVSIILLKILWKYCKKKFQESQRTKKFEVLEDKIQDIENFEGGDPFRQQQSKEKKVFSVQEQEQS